VTLAPQDGRVVVVSPHLDDAVLSCGGLLASTPGHVVTVYCAVPPAGLAAPMWDRMTGAIDPVARMHDRLAEDDAALATLGATTTRVGLLDEQYRSEPLPPDAVPAALGPLLAGAAQVHVPAAMGSHPDHVATRDGALAAAPASAEVWLYADLPYALAFGWPSWVDGRDPQPMLDPSPWLEDELAGAGLDPAGLTAVVRELSAEAAARKRRAMSSYVSQLPALETLSGGRLTHPHASRFELAWRVTRDPGPG
jgi:LmbE family N-acetylglucosaminyl deacetylase